MPFGIPTLVLVFYVLAFVAGIATIPIIAYAVGGLLPAFIAEPISNGLFAVSFLGVQDPTLDQSKTGEYVIRPGDPDVEPKSYWTRFALSRFAISADLSRDAFDTHPVDPTDVETTPISGEPGVAEVVNMARGGIKSFVELGENVDYYLPVGQLLSAFQHSGGLEIAFDAEATAEKEHGGDTSTYSPKLRVMGHALFAVMGAGMGYLFFVG